MIRFPADQVIAPLFVPALEIRKLRKAESLAEAVIVDLEDSVVDVDKSRAAQWLNELPPPAGRAQRWVRVNGDSSGRLRDDIDAINKYVSVVVLPKCDGADHLEALYAELDRVGSQAVVVPMIETARGLENIGEIARHSPTRVSRLALGLADLAADMGLPLQPHSMLVSYALARLVLASRAAELAEPLDAPHLRLDDADVLAEVASLAKGTGFGGKLCIHPSQVPVIHAVFTPKESELLRAEQILTAFRRAADHGRASVIVEGEFVDLPVAMQAHRMLKQSEWPQGPDIELREDSS